MTDFRIEKIAFETENVSTWRLADPKYSNWPVVYIISEEDKSHLPLRPVHFLAPEE